MNLIAITVERICIIYIYGLIGEIWLIDLPMVRFTVLLAQVPKKIQAPKRVPLF